MSPALCLFFEIVLCIAEPAPLPQAPPQQPPRILDDIDRRDLEDYGFDPDGPDSESEGDEVDLALDALLKATSSP